ncbi:murein biosynthesis integral membrane protein MurJ [Alkalibacterium psychrotolerans]
MKKTVLLLMIITVFSKLIGFSREIILAYYYGASMISDAYIISLTIPALVVAILGSSIAAAYIPLYSRIEDREGTQKANEFTNNLLNVFIILCFIIVGASLIFTEQIILIVASGFGEESLSLAVSMTRITMFGILFSTIISVLQPYLQMKGDYITPSYIGISFDLVMILAIVFSTKDYILILSYGFLIAKITQVLILLGSAKRKNYSYSFFINIKDSELHNMLYLILPIILGVAVTDINKIIDRTLASQIVIGGISALDYAQKINSMIIGVLIASIGTVMYPIVSKMVVQSNIKGLKAILSQSIVGTSLIVMPSMLGLMFLSYPVVGFLFGRGAFDAEAIQVTSNALFFYSFGMIGISLRDLLSKPFYAYEDTKTPMINSAIGVSINIILNIILSRFLGLGGIALATSISSIITAILMFVSLQKKIGNLQMKDTFITCVKLLLASIIMGVCSRLSFNYLSGIWSQNVALLFSVGIGVLIYLVSLYFIKINELNKFVSTIKNKYH